MIRKSDTEVERRDNSAKMAVPNPDALRRAVGDGRRCSRAKVAIFHASSKHLCLCLAEVFGQCQSQVGDAAAAV